jgi:hypothetical protein
MAHDDLILQFLLNLKKATIADIATPHHALGHSKSLQSSKTTVGRALNGAVDRGELKEEKIDGRSVFMLPHLTGYSDHDKLLTEALVMILCLYSAKIVREKIIEHVALRPDAIVCVQRTGFACVLIIEAVSTENSQFFNTKRQVWDNWLGSKEYLSNLFGLNVKYFHLVTHGKRMGVLTLEEALKLMEVENGTISQ